LHAADIYCQPNIEREPFGIALVEAMNSGLPIVTTDLGATADPVGPEIGRRVGVEPSQLAAALAELIEDQRKRESLGAAARRRYAECHSPGTAIRDLTIALECGAERPRSRSRGPAEWA
jgi:glycosyltransferase involved in cell wall biosynthesis